MDIISQDAKNLLVKHQEEIKKSVLLPLFVDALITGGITLFDEVRSLLENAGICLDDLIFSFCCKTSVFL